MKHKFLSGLTSVLCLVLIFTACKKDSVPSKSATTDAEIATQSDDGNRVSGEIEAVATDANTVIESDNSFSGNALTVSEIVCDATVSVNKTTDPMTITITYNGTNCGGARKRTGEVVISMAKQTKWVNAGATITVAYNNLKVVRTKDNKAITLNGTQTFTNVDGGLLINLATNGPITHTITSDDMSITFDDGTQRSWHMARRHVYSFENGAVLSITGMHTIGNIENITDWGQNRFGTEFTTAITGAVVIKQACDFRITGGEVTHITPDFTAVVTFGLNETGVATGCPGTGSYFYKLGCTRKNGNRFEIILPY